ncbi:DUF6301 family protein [Nocardia sp. CA-151230]|uniref:DUF6301 family protein n=1 Tax=Nocardia sp. CA-151230 TaxID=3239982 RepID=UPI003D933261
MNRLLLTLTGRLDQPQLDELCKAMGLTGIGAVADPIGTVLGTRAAGGRTLAIAKLALWRSGTSEWTLGIDEWLMTPGQEFAASPAAWRGLAELSVRAVGLTICDRWEFSDDQTRPEANPTWPRLEYDEIVALVARLVSLDPTWTSDPNSIAGKFGWQISECGPGVYQLGTGPGTAKGYLYWRDGQVIGVEIPITMPVPDNDEPRLGYTFILLSPILDAALGRSAEPHSSRRDEIVWANDDLRLTLSLLAPDIRLFAIPKR